MQPHAVLSSHPAFRIGQDEQFALIQPELGAQVAHFESQTQVRRRVWLGEGAYESVCPILPVMAGAHPRWDVARRSRDQIELECVYGDASGPVHWCGRYLITADECGLHLALGIENVRPAVLSGRIGLRFHLPAPAGSVLAVPPGAIGGHGEISSSDSPFAWPRRSILTHEGGDRLEVRAQSPLARTEVRRQTGQVVLSVLAPGTLAAGATMRLECRLRATLGGARIGQPPSD